MASTPTTPNPLSEVDWAVVNEGFRRIGEAFDEFGKAVTRAGSTMEQFWEIVRFRMRGGRWISPNTTPPFKRNKNHGYGRGLKN